MPDGLRQSVQGRQHLVFPLGFGGLGKDGRSAAGFHEPGSQGVHVPYFSDAASQNSLDAFAHRQLACQGFVQLRPTLLPHTPQGFLQPGRREDVHILRLLNLDGQRGLKRPVEHPIAGQILKIGNHDPIALLESE